MSERSTLLLAFVGASAFALAVIANFSDDITTQASRPLRSLYNNGHVCSDGYEVAMQNDDGYVCWRTK